MPATFRKLAIAYCCSVMFERASLGSRGHQSTLSDIFVSSDRMPS